MCQSWHSSTGEVCINRLSPAAPGAYSVSVCRWMVCEGDGVRLCGQAGRSLAYLLHKFGTQDGTREPAFNLTRT